jgi:cysteine desulfurase
MEKNGIIISVGSACNTSSAKASHVLTALRAPTEIKRGVIRVSWCDYTTVEDIEAFVSALVVLSSTKIPIPTKTSAPLPKKK